MSRPPLTVRMVDPEGHTFHKPNRHVRPRLARDVMDVVMGAVLVGLVLLLAVLVML